MREVVCCGGIQVRRCLAVNVRNAFTARYDVEHVD